MDFLKASEAIPVHCPSRWRVRFSSSWQANPHMAWPGPQLSRSLAGPYPQPLLLHDQLPGFLGRCLVKIWGVDKKATDQYKNIGKPMKSLWILQKSGFLCLCKISYECLPQKHDRNHSPMAVFSASYRSPIPASLHLTSPGFQQISQIFSWKFFPIAAFSCLSCASHFCVRFHNFAFTHLQT